MIEGQGPLLTRSAITFTRMSICKWCFGPLSIERDLFPKVLLSCDADLNAIMAYLWIVKLQ